MSMRKSKDIAAIIREGTAVDRAIVAARRRVIRRHRQLGVPLVIWRDGRLVEVAADTVELPPDGDDSKVQER